MSKYYPDEEFPTFCDPETHEAFRQFAENGGAALLKNCNFRLKTSQNENNRLEAQIKKLSHIKKNWDEKIKEIRHTRLKELLKDVQKCAYLVDCKYEYSHVKCDKCDDERKIHFKHRLGKNLQNLVLALAKYYVIFCAKFRFIKSKLAVVMGKNEYHLSIFTNKEKTKSDTLWEISETNLTMKRFQRVILGNQPF